ncbi:MAG: biotin--[acetyl-CoA-carboxylase] ligase [Pseudomonadota bacterium]
MSASWPVHWLASVDSTNEEAKRRAMASAGFRDQWIVAREQTRGRGRLGRVWKSPVGNLYATALMAWTHPVAMSLRLPFAAALAMSDVVYALAPQANCRLKWPNDVRCDGAKISGILVESGETPAGRWIAVGLGLNVQFVPEDLGQAGTSLADLRGDGLVTPDGAFTALEEAFAVRLAEALDGFETIRTAWLERAEGIGKAVRVTAENGPIEGIFTDLGADGALLLQLPDGSMKTIRAGDVELIRDVSA